MCRRGSTAQEAIDKTKASRDGIAGFVQLHQEVIKRAFDSCKAKHLMEQAETAGYTVCSAVRSRLHKQEALDLIRFGETAKLTHHLHTYACPDAKHRCDMNKISVELGLGKLIAGMTGKDGTAVPADMKAVLKIHNVCAGVASCPNELVDEDAKQDLTDFGEVTDIDEEATHSPKEAHTYKYTDHMQLIFSSNR